MATSELGSVVQFDCKTDDGDTATRWRKWLKSFNYYIVARGISNIERKVAMLMHCAGPDVQELFETLSDPDPDSDDDEYVKTVRMLNAHFVKKKVNKPYERHVFRSLK